MKDIDVAALQKAEQSGATSSKKANVDEESSLFSSLDDEELDALVKSFSEAFNS